MMRCGRSSCLMFAWNHTVTENTTLDRQTELYQPDAGCDQLVSLTWRTEPNQTSFRGLQYLMRCPMRVPTENVKAKSCVFCPRFPPAIFQLIYYNWCPGSSSKPCTDAFLSCRNLLQWEMKARTEYATANVGRPQAASAWNRT